MTVLSDPPEVRSDPPAPSSEPAVDVAPGRRPSPPAPASAPVGRLVLVWALVALAGIVVVLVAVGPVTEQRDQRRLLEDQRQAIDSASNEAFGLAGIEVPTEAPVPGSPVGVLDVAALDLRRVVVEGTDPEQTRTGPGHVIGTGGLGQPGNAVVVGRRSAFGGAFGDLDRLQEGDRILVSTTQGQSVYEVGHVGVHRVVDEAVTEDVVLGEAGATPTTLDLAADAADAAAGAEAAVDGSRAPLLPDGAVTVDQLYGPSEDDRLTLVTSASGLPWNADEAVVVVAVLDGVAFEPTPQGGRVPGADGRGGADGVLAPLGLALLAYAAAVGAAVWFHRKVPWRSAYLVTAPLLVALTVVLAEQLAMALPAWA